MSPVPGPRYPVPVAARSSIVGRVPLRNGELHELMLAAEDGAELLIAMRSLAKPELLVTHDAATGWALQLLARWRGTPVRIVA